MARFWLNRAKCWYLKMTTMPLNLDIILWTSSALAQLPLSFVISTLKHSHIHAMAHLANLNGVSENLLINPKPFHIEKTRLRPTFLRPFCKKTEQSQETELPITKKLIPKQTTRRGVLGLAAVALSLQSSVEQSFAEDNGFWNTDFPIPRPPIYNKIANEETGTRSFLKKGVYMANIGPDGSAYRLRKYAFDLIALEDLLDKDAWNYVRQYLRLKSTFMYYDFDKVISAAPADDKQPLIDLANRLFDKVEKLEVYVRKHDDQTDACYQDTKVVLEEVLNHNFKGISI